jgi:PAS domain S-box-containing protein
MKEIIMSAKLRPRIKLNLDIMADFFSTKDLKMCVIASDNRNRIFTQQNDDIKKPVIESAVTNNLYKKLFDLKEQKVKLFLAKYLTDFKNELMFFKLNINDYIYIIYFPYQKVNIKHNSTALNRFKKQFQFLLKDIYSQEKKEIYLNQRSKENSNLRREKYIAASALDSVPGNVAILNEAGNIVYINLAWDRFAVENIAIARAFKIGKNYLKAAKEVVGESSDIFDELNHGLKQLLNREKEYFTFDYSWSSAGKKRWFRMYASSFKGIGEYEILIVHQDITKEIIAQKTAETLLDQLPGLLMKFNEKQELIYFNKRAAQNFNLTSNDCGQQFMGLTLDNEESQSYQDKIVEALQEEKIIDCRVILSKNNRQLSYKNILLPYYETDNSKSVISIIPFHNQQFISKRSNYNITNPYLQLFNNFPEALVLLDNEGKIINSNKKFGQLFGFEMKELKNKELSSLIADKEDKAAKDLAHLVLTGDKIDHSVVRIDSQGKRLNLNLIAFPILLHINRIGIFAIYRETK